MSDLFWFIAGFTTRAMIGFVSRVSFKWRSDRAWRRYVKERERKEMTIMRWKVTAHGIQWDVGDPDDYDPATYDPSVLPESASAEVSADDELEAVENALNELSDQYGFLIDDTSKCEVELLPQRRRRTD